MTLPHTSHAVLASDVSSILSGMVAALATLDPRGSSAQASLGYRTGTHSKHIVGGDTSCGRGKRSLELLFVCLRNMGNALDAFFPCFVSMGSVGR
jgi:hypothetical protein